MAKWREEKGDYSLLYLKITPNAAQTKIAGEAVDADGRTRLHIRIATPPEDGKANKALIKFLSKHFKLPQSAFSIQSGQSSRLKVMRVELTN